MHVHRTIIFIAAVAVSSTSAFVPLARASERIIVNEENWNDVVPAGKEVDCIYGDIVLRNERIVAVIANPIASRNANMTVRAVGGSVIDLTSRQDANDQLSAFYPGGNALELRAADQPASVEATAEAETVTFKCQSTAQSGQPLVTVIYSLSDGNDYLEVRNIYENPHETPVEVELNDAVRADRSFEFALNLDHKLLIAQDQWWHQTYGIFCPERSIEAVSDTMERGRPVVRYLQDGQDNGTLLPEERIVLRRYLFPARHDIQAQAIARRIRQQELQSVTIQVVDPDGPVENALVTVNHANDQEGGTAKYGSYRTEASGMSCLSLPAGSYTIRAEANGRGSRQVEISTGSSDEVVIELDTPGYVVAAITSDGQSVPCKVEFRGKDGTPDPFFGPDTYVDRIHNLVYSHDGSFRQSLAPGSYNVIISHGNEYDAVFTSVDVSAGKETSLTAALVRSVDTSGWVSSDFHSHSSPSGDNTSSQRGRVLNLLAEHIEFAPCTEHNRISSYVPHLEHYDVLPLMATCSGMELTGSPLPVNHQNAFPLVHRPRTQDGGAPVTDENPLIQIERLSFWDHQSEKVVQGNHPNLRQIVGDKDTNGMPDGGFDRMLGFMDVVEVHPPQGIFRVPPKDLPPRERGNVIFNWMQLLNLGYRIPGVVNTDAHYNFHGSGWLRNYLKSPTDEPSQVAVADMIKAAEAGHIVMTNGPFLEVNAETIRLGELQRGTAGSQLVAEDGTVSLSIRVQCPNWLDINRVQLFLNGRPAEDLNFTRRNNPDEFENGVVKFDKQLDVALERDTHIIVAVAGEGLTLGPVMGPQRGEVMPVAVANPVFVDVDGEGFLPNADQLDRPLPLDD